MIFPVKLSVVTGRVMEFWLAITVTDGAWFGAGGFTVMGMLTELLSCESEAVSFST